jgi:hypothetical protein
MTLMNLNATTLMNSSETSDEYVPTGTDEDEYRQHKQYVSHAGLGDVLSDDDLDDSGLSRAGA